MNKFIIIISLFFISCAVGPPRYDTRDCKETLDPACGYHVVDTGNPPPNIYDYLGLVRPPGEVRHKSELQETNRMVVLKVRKRVSNLE